MNVSSVVCSSGLANSRCFTAFGLPPGRCAVNADSGRPSNAQPRTGSPVAGAERCLTSYGMSAQKGCVTGQTGCMGAPAGCIGAAAGCIGPVIGCPGAAEATAGGTTAPASDRPTAHRMPADKVRIFDISDSLPRFPERRFAMN